MGPEIWGRNRGVAGRLRSKPLSTAAVLTATPVKAVKNGFTHFMNIINSVFTIILSVL